MGGAPNFFVHQGALPSDVGAHWLSWGDFVVRLLVSMAISPNGNEF